MYFRHSPSFLRHGSGLSNGSRYINPSLSHRLYHQTKGLQQWGAVRFPRFSPRTSGAISRWCNKASSLIWGERIERGININYRGPSYETSTKLHSEHKHIVAIRHPEFPDEDTEPLIILTALDKTPENGWGVQHAIARACCDILTAKHQGYLSHDIAGKDRVDLAEDAILPAGTYYFQVPGEKLYLIYSAFETWSTPGPVFAELAKNLYRVGSKSQDKNPREDETANDNISEEKRGRGEPVDDQKPVGDEPMSGVKSFKRAVRHRDGHRCVVSGDDVGMTVAHIVPRSSYEEYVRDGLYRLNHDWGKPGTFQGDPTTATKEQKQLLTDSRNNGLLLRHDVHDVFDGNNENPSFIFFPKWRQPNVIHFMTGNSSLSTEYHNKRAPICHSVPTEFLFARTVSTVFKHVEHGRKVRKRSGVKEKKLPRFESTGSGN